jgi:HEAT repeat protein
MPRTPSALRRIEDRSRPGPELLRERLPSSAGKIRALLEADPRMESGLLQARLLAAGLDEPNSRRRAEVREKMRALGEPALPVFLEALSDPSANVRWQAAKALSAWHDPRTAPDLVRAMEDDDFGVRWHAAEGLVAIGPGCLEALLQGLMADFVSPRMREAAQHVLCLLVDNGDDDETIEVLIRALQPSEPAEDAGWAAEKAWEKIQAGGTHR